MSHRETWQEEYDRCMARALELRAEGNEFEADAYVRQARYAQMDGWVKGETEDPEAIPIR